LIYLISCCFNPKP